MTIPSFNDLVNLSASLDGQLSSTELSRLESRIEQNAPFAAALEDLRQTRLLLRRTPARRVPRNFTLNLAMAGLKPPLPRLVPVFSWASVTAMLLFLFTMGANFLGSLSFSAAAPRMVSAPMNSEAYGVGGGPPATVAPASDNTQAIPTEQNLAVQSPEPTPLSESRPLPPEVTPVPKQTVEPVRIISYLFLGIALVLIAAALLIGWTNERAFRRRSGAKNEH
jgi:anti-sigma factor RsiW